MLFRHPTFWESFIGLLSHQHRASRPNCSHRGRQSWTRHHSLSNPSARRTTSIMPPKGKPQNKTGRPTHFVCFPLTTDESIPQLAASLSFFKLVTTRLDRDAIPRTLQGSNEASRPELETSSTGAPGDQNHQTSRFTTLTDIQNTASGRNLHILPSEAYRPPGTFHLTLGAMDLSDPEDLEKAVRLLEDIDYASLLREVGRQEGGPNVGGRETNQRRRELRRDSGRETAEDTITKIVDSSLTSPPKSLTRTISPPPKPSQSSPPQNSSGSESPPRPSSPPSTFIDQTPISASSPASLSITLGNLGTFPRPASSRVFFAHPHDPTNRLQRLAELIRQRFQAVDLITETRPLVLHATVANLIYAKGKGRGGRPHRRGHGTQDGNCVDARDILGYFNETLRPMGSQDQPAQTSQIPRPNTPSPPTPFPPLSTPPLLPDPTKPSPSTTTTPEESNFNFIWARDIPIDRIRICKMGAEKSDIPGWGLEYKPVAENVFVTHFS